MDSLWTCWCSLGCQIAGRKYLPYLCPGPGQRCICVWYRLLWSEGHTHHMDTWLQKAWLAHPVWCLVSWKEEEHIKRWWTLIFCIHVSPPAISDKFWPEGEGVLLCVDNVSVFTSLAILLFGVHLRVLGVLRTCGVSVVPTAHQVETPCSVTASLRWGDRSKYYINNINVGVNSIGSSALNDEIKCS